MFGDNKSVVTSSTMPHSKLNKRHNALSYHRVREAIAAKIIDFLHIDGKPNPPNVLSKYCEHVNAWPHLKWLLFWQGAPPSRPGQGGTRRCTTRRGPLLDPEADEFGTADVFLDDIFSAIPQLDGDSPGDRGAHWTSSGDRYSLTAASLYLVTKSLPSTRQLPKAPRRKG